MPSCKLCKKARLKGETSNELTAGVGLSSTECTFDLNVPSNRPPLRTNMKLIERTHSNRGSAVCPDRIKMTCSCFDWTLSDVRLLSFALHKATLHSLATLKYLREQGRGTNGCNLYPFKWP